MATPGLRVDQVADAITQVAGVALSILQASPSTTRTTTSSSYADIDSNFEVTISVPITGTYLVMLKSGGLYDAASGGCEARFRILVDGYAATTDDKRWEGSIPSASVRENWSCQETVSLTAGSRTFKIQWKRQSGGGTVALDTTSHFNLQAILISGSGAGGVLVDSDIQTGSTVDYTGASFQNLKRVTAGADLEVSVTTFAGEKVYVIFDGDAHNPSGTDNWADIKIVMDGTTTIAGNRRKFIGASHDQDISLAGWTAALTAGTHSFKIQIYINGGLTIRTATDSNRPFTLSVLRFRGGLNRPDTARPRMSYNAVGKIDVMAVSNMGNEVRQTLSDGKQRTFGGTLTFDFANGVAENGLDTGSEASSTWYYLYLVPKSSNDTQLVLRASVTNPATGPTGYTIWKYIGAFRNDGSSNIIKFSQIGSKTIIEQQTVFSAAPTTGASEAAPGTLVSLADYVPATASRAYIDYYLAAASGDHWVAQLRDNSANQVISGGELQAYRGASAELSYDFPLPVSTKSIYRRVFRNSGSGSNADWHILWCNGWIDGSLDELGNPGGLGATGSAGGDLTGTYPSPTVAKIYNNAVTSSAPSLSGTAYVWDGSAYNLSSRAWALGTTDGYGFKLANTTSATSGNQQYSPSIHMQGQGYATSPASSFPVTFRLRTIPVQSTTLPTGDLELSYAVSGVAYDNVWTFKTSGILQSIRNWSGCTATTTDGFIIDNTTAANGSNDQYSPSFRLSGKVWNTTTTTSQDASYKMYVETFRGSNTTRQAVFNLTYSINGGAYTNHTRFANLDEELNQRTVLWLGYGATATPIIQSVGSFGIGTGDSSSAIGLDLRNQSAATVGTMQYSPLIRLGGNGWSTTSSVSRTAHCVIQNRPISGSTNPSAELNVEFNINGAGNVNAAKITSGGVVSAATSIRARGDDGAGEASSTSITNATASAGSTAATMINVPTAALSGTQATWLKVYIGTTVTYIPCWQ